jgi:dUTP pyrophosphatase
MNLRVKIKRLHDAAVIPKYAREGDAGFDLVACQDVVIEPGATVIIPTGLAFELPPRYELQVRPRSGITVKSKLRVALGTVDSGFRGEVGVIVDNIWRKYEGKFTKKYIKLDGMPEPVAGGYSCSKGTYIIRKGDRIAQAVIAPVEQAHFVEVDELGETSRGSNGFGSSGVKSSFDKAANQNGNALKELAEND